MKYRKKTKNNKCVSIPKSFISIDNENIKIAPLFFKKDSLFKISKKTFLKK